MLARAHSLSQAYARLMLNPLAPGPGVCAVCRDLVEAPHRRCAGCARHPDHLDALAPVSYSVGGGRLHRELRAYKDDPVEAVRDQCTLGLAAVLERFLVEHERCLAEAARAGDGFDLVCAVPSAAGARPDEARGRLREILGQRCPVTAARFRRLLAPSGEARAAVPHHWSGERFRALVALRGAAVLVVDDTWTTGASGQAAACALRRAGAGRVALVAIGRHVNPGHSDNAARLAALPEFDWARCALCGPPGRAPTVT